MRGCVAVIAALICAIMGSILVAFVGCFLAASTDSIALAWITVALTILAAIVCGYYGAKLALDDGSGSEHRSPRKKDWPNE
jgi:uncharacterized membrane protein YfcA